MTTDIDIHIKRTADLAELPPLSYCDSGHYWVPGSRSSLTGDCDECAADSWRRERERRAQN